MSAADIIFCSSTSNSSVSASFSGSRCSALAMSVPRGFFPAAAKAAKSSFSLCQLASTLSTFLRYSLLEQACRNHAIGFAIFRLLSLYTSSVWFTISKPPYCLTQSSRKTWLNTGRWPLFVFCVCKKPAFDFVVSVFKLSTVSTVSTMASLLRIKQVFSLTFHIPSLQARGLVNPREDSRIFARVAFGTVVLPG